MRQASNRTFSRILASLPPELARRYGHVETGLSHYEEKLAGAIAAKDWRFVAELASELAKTAKTKHPETG